MDREGKEGLAAHAGSPGAPERWAPRFFCIWTGQALSLFGSALVQFGLVWWLTRETGSATLLAMASLVALLPQVLLGPFVGALVDRRDRKRVMILADLSIALVTLALAAAFALGAVRVWMVFAALAARSLGAAFHGTAMRASTTLLVPDSALTRVAGLNQGLEGLIAIVAPPAGALLLGLMPTEGLLLIDVATAAAAIATLAGFSIPRPAAAGQAGESFLAGLKGGFAYVAAWPGLLALMALAMLINFLLSPTASLMPLLVTGHFGKGALELGGLESLLGFGMIAGGILLGAWGGFRRRISTSILGIIGIGLATLAVGLAGRGMFALAGGAFFLMGLSSPVANGPIGAIFQSVVKPEMQGRVFSLIGSAATAMMPLGLLVAGPFSDAFGIRAWYVGAGALCVALAAAARFLPVLMDIEGNRGAAVAAGGN